MTDRETDQETHTRSCRRPRDNRVKTLVITSQYKHTQLDAALGYFHHGGNVEDGLFSTVTLFYLLGKGRCPGFHERHFLNF